MTVKSQARGDRRVVRNNVQGIPTRCDTVEALDKGTVAELSAAVINDMTCDELVRVIRVANLPAQLCPDLDRHLPFYDRPVLTRLAYLARQCCRKQESGSLGKDAE